MLEFLQDNSVPYQSIILALSGGVFAFEQYLKYYSSTASSQAQSAPPSIAPYLLTADGAKTEAEKKDKPKEGEESLSPQETFMSHRLETWALLSPLVAVYFGGDGSKPASGIAGLWYLAIDLSHRSVELLPAKLNIGTGEIATSMFFVCLLSLTGMITSIPSSLYKTFRSRRKHGFNKQSLALWITDYIKTTILSAVFGLPLIAAFLWTVRWAGEAFVQYVMVLVMGLVLFMYVGYPYLIAPLFNKFRHLGEFPEYEEVKTRTEALAKRVNYFPLGRLWVIDGSKRSAHSNAFFFGLPGFTKHIVLYDTLLKQSTPAEVEAVLARSLEVKPYGITIRFIATPDRLEFIDLPIFYLECSIVLFLWSTNLTGTEGKYPLIIGFILAQSLFTPLNSLLSFTSNALSRKLEFQADQFAADLGGDYAKDLKWALVRISAENKATTSCDWLYSAFHHSHPTLPERLGRLSIESDKNKKNQ
ncbi:hypothetical protein H4Q26_002791 [Puccinia striiformis f. sp. tritici PST-130]|nr:hypothetical protein H4Q26_002791 [Puccinia striiformis f. sp. tritici PST-130]